MSNTVDRRVVEMRFDNAQFERNARATMTTVEKLKQSLNFKGFRDNFDAISDSVRGVDFSGMEQGIGKVSNAFSFFGNLAFNVMDKINKSIADFVVNTAKSVSIEQVAQGWTKYEEKTNSVATIMSATGMSIEEVEKELEKLIWFADETSYSFTDMTSNVGKFTSVGVDLPVAVEAMEGIANWAALSGQNAQTASRAMYNLSQAMGVGSVKLMDWRSIENASMATKEFKEQAIETAKALKILNAEGKIHGTDTIVTYENFSSTLEKGWFTADVLLKTLEKYGNYTSAVYEVSDSFDTCSEAMKNTSEEGMELGAKAFRAAQEAKTFKDAVDATADAVSSQWLTMFQTIFGNYEQAKVIWTELTNVMWDIFASPLDEINSVLKDWADTYYNIEYNVWTKLTNLEKEKYSDNWMSGRDLLIDNVRIAWEDLTKVLSTVSDAFDMVFDSIGTDELMKAIGGIRQFLVSLEISESTAISLRNGFYYTFQAIKNGINFVVDSTKTLFGVMSDVVKEFGIFDGAGSKILEMFKTVAKGAFDFAKNLKLSDKFVEDFKRTFSGIVAVVDIIKQLASALIGPLINGFKIIGSAAVSLLGNIFGITGGLGDFLVKIDEFIKKHDIFGKVVGFFSDVLGSLGKIVLGVKNYIQAFINTLKFNLEKLGLFDGIEGIKNRIEQLKGYFQKLKDLIDGFFNKSVKKNEVSQQLEDTSKKADIFLRAGEKIKSVISDLYEKVRGFLDAHGFEGKTILDIALDALNGFLGSGALIAVMALISKWKSGGVVDIIFGDNGPIGLIAQAFGENSLTDVWNKLKSNLGQIKTATVDTLKGVKESMQAFQNEIKSNILNKIANAILKIAAACILLSFVDPVRLAASMTAVTVAMGELVGSLYLFKDLKGAQGAIELTVISTAISQLSNAMLKMSAAIFIMGKLDPKQMATSLAGFSAIIAEMMVLMYLLSEIPFKDVTAYVTAINGIAGAMITFALSLAVLALIPGERLYNAVLALTAILTEMMVMMYVLTQMTRGTFSSANIEMATSVIVTISGAMMILAGAVALLAILPVENVSNAVLAIGVMMAALAFSVYAIAQLPVDKVTLAGVATLVARLSSSLFTIAFAIKTLADIEDFNKVKEALTALIVGLAAIVLAVGLLANIDAPTLTSTATGLILVAGALLVLSVAVKLLSTIPTESLAWSIVGIAAMIGILIGATYLLGPISPELMAVAASILVFAAAILALGIAAAAFGVGIASIVGALFTLSKLGPDAAKSAMEAVGVILTELLKMIPTVILMIGELMVGIAGLIMQKIGLITAVVIAIVGAICTALENSIIRITTMILRIISAILEAILEFAPTIILTGMKVLLMFLQGIADNIWQITNLVMEIISAFLVGVASHIDEIIESAWTIMLAFIGGFVDHIDEMVILGVDFMVNFINGITEKIDDLIQAGVDLIFAFIDGLANAIEENTPIFQEKMSHLFQVCIDAVLILLEGAIEDLKTAGRKIINSGFVEGIKEKIGLAKDKVSEMIDGIKQRIELKIESFKEAGKNIIQGLIDGIVSIKDTVVNTVEGVATDALDAFKKVLGIESPSKVFEECGYFIDKGAANGVAKNSNILDSAIEDAGNSAVDSMRGALSNLSGIVDGTMDTNPTIAPILDLTNVQNGANSLNSMFDNQQVALAATGFNIASDYAAQNNAMTNFMKSIAKSNEEMTNRLEAAFNNSRTNITVESKLEPNSARFFKSMRSEAKFYNMQTGN